MKSKMQHFLNNNYDQLYFGYNKIFLGSLIFKGNKLFAFNFFIKIKYFLKLKESTNPSLIFFIAMLNVSPNVFLKSKILKKSKKYIPVLISFSKKIMFSVKWVLKPFTDKKKIIATTIVDILSSSFYNRGSAIKKKKEYYKLVILNRFLIRFHK